MGLIQAVVEHKKSLDELGLAIDSMPSAIEDIDDPEQRGMFAYLQEQIEKGYQELKETSECLIEAIDNYLY